MTETPPPPTYTQANRPIKISAVGTCAEDTLLLRSFTLTDELGTPFLIQAELESTNSNLHFTQIVGQQVTITLTLGEKSGSTDAITRSLVGFIVAFQAVSAGSGTAYPPLSVYAATIVPGIALLKHSSQCRIYQTGGKTSPTSNTVVNILTDPSHGVLSLIPNTTFTSSNCKSSYSVLPYCTQYNETDLDFAHRLMQAQGLYYFHEQDFHGQTQAASELVLADSLLSHVAFTGFSKLTFDDSTNPATTNAITSWQRSMQTVPTKLEMMDSFWNCTPVMAEGTSQSASAPKLAAAQLPESLSQYGFDLTVPTTVANAPSTDKTPADTWGTLLAQVRRQALAVDQIGFTGTSNGMALAVGYTFEVNGLPVASPYKSYLVVSQILTVLTPSFSTTPSGSGGTDIVNAFSAIPASAPTGTYLAPFRRKWNVPKPRIAGVQTATVVGPSTPTSTSFTDKDSGIGCVCVQFRWDANDFASGSAGADGTTQQPCTAFVRVALPSASKSFGTILLPHIGDEVVVTFEDGDPDRPLVVGCLYNATNKPNQAPTNSNTISEFRDSANNFIQFNSDSGESNRGITLSTPNNNTYMTLGPDGYTFNSSKDMTINCGGKHWNLVEKISDTQLGVDKKQVGGLSMETVGGADLKFVGGLNHSTYAGAYGKLILGVAEQIALSPALAIFQFTVGTALSVNSGNKTDIINGNSLKVFAGADEKLCVNEKKSSATLEELNGAYKELVAKSNAVVAKRTDTIASYDVAYADANLKAADFKKVCASLNITAAEAFERGATKNIVQETYTLTAGEQTFTGEMFEFA
jgi:type VI secretion system secreted protein VgrG